MPALIASDRLVHGMSAEKVDRPTDHELAQAKANAMTAQERREYLLGVGVKPGTNDTNGNVTNGNVGE